MLIPKLVPLIALLAELWKAGNVLTKAPVPDPGFIQSVDNFNKKGASWGSDGKTDCNVGDPCFLHTPESGRS